MADFEDSRNQDFLTQEHLGPCELSIMELFIAIVAGLGHKNTLKIFLGAKRSVVVLVTLDTGFQSY